VLARVGRQRGNIQIHQRPLLSRDQDGERGWREGGSGWGEEIKSNSGL
jgi:hypothetical protein